MRASTMRLLNGAMRREKASLWAALFAELVPFFRDGDTLRPIEAAWLADWLEETGCGDLQPEDVQTVQVPRDWAAKVLGGHPQNATRALQDLQTTGMLTPIHKGIKGHATLYCVNPLPKAGSHTLTHDEGKCEGKYPHTSDEYPHTSSDIPSHQDSATWGDAT